MTLMPDNNAEVNEALRNAAMSSEGGFNQIGDMFKNGQGGFLEALTGENVDMNEMFQDLGSGFEGLVSMLENFGNGTFALDGPGGMMDVLKETFGIEPEIVPADDSFRTPGIVPEQSPSMAQSTQAPGQNAVFEQTPSPGGWTGGA
jgi:hypothetical protein